METQVQGDDIDNALYINKASAEVALRRVLAYARAQAAQHRSDDPVQGRAMAMMATHVEDALRILIMPVP